MRIISLTEKINRDQKIIWKWISDYGNIHRIHPALTHSYIVGDKQCGVGAIRVCEMPGKNFMKEQVVEWEEGRFFTIELIETSMPMKSARATIGINELAENLSELYMKVSYTPKFGVFGKIMDILVLQFMMKKMMEGIFKTLKKEIA
ncbi:MAG: hypothetical protein A2622_09970 [Bdellovibrionales bacterium RIFCSPHIGHO2_01_FULL_40_29]|nr:MAG: hypothetical protein A2622_09970 [Bdellovibrionales bacterium RIFCSPHIGHO2_01_FULL_40_29]OFZ32427.1 MAG: hypothetical protein A3D17_12690 [Bdellovibrionales bacterium RIFCSPHIGHO2_02_FULL_40_15]